MKIKIILILIILILFSVVLISLKNNSIIGKAIYDDSEYSYTKAICNSSNFCQDYEIKCRKNKTVDYQPITGAVIQHSENWKDPRNNSDNLCE